MIQWGFPSDELREVHGRGVPYSAYNRFHEVMAEESGQSVVAGLVPYVLPLRVYRAAQTWELPEAPSYAGCKSWVELERGLPAEGATPVLTEEAFDDVLRALDRILEPTAWV